MPEPWLLGSSPQSGIWAAELGLPYAFADFINPTGAQIAAEYRTNFVETGRAPLPRVAVGVWAICAETDEEAQRLAASARMTMSMLRRGRPIPVPPPDKAVRFLESEGQALDAMPPGRRTVVGSPETVAAGLREVAESYGADEVVVVSITYDHEARRRCYELIAEAFDLAGTAAAQRVAS